MKIKQIEHLLAKALRDRYAVSVTEAPGERAEVRLSRPDAEERSFKLHAENWKPALGQARPYRPKHLWVLQNALRATADELRESRQSFVDLNRHKVYLDLPNLLVDRTVPPERQNETHRWDSFQLTRRLSDPFADRASLLTRVLLESPGTTWTVTGLAEAAGVVPMLSSHIVRQLAAEEIVRTRKDGRKLLVELVAPRRLLEAWTARYDWRSNTALPLAAPVADEERFLHRFAEMMGQRKWALTLLAGAWLRTRYAPTDRLHVYIETATNADLKNVARTLEWSSEPTGRLVLLRPAYRTSVWHGMQSVRDLPVVSDLQLIVDLWHYPVRGRETAEQMFARVQQRFERTLNLPGREE